MSKILSFAGYAPRRSNADDRKQLPSNQSFVTKILDATLVHFDRRDCVIFSVDITEGEYTNFYRKDYDARANSPYDRKWRGTYYLTVPSEGTQYYERDLLRFNHAIGAIEASNPGFSFAATMDTDDLCGKAVGILTRAAELDGHPYTEIGVLLTVEDARAQRFRPMKPNIRSSKSHISGPTDSANTHTSAFEAKDEGLPF